jgi:hypothetical protein
MAHHRFRRCRFSLFCEHLHFRRWGSEIIRAIQESRITLRTLDLRGVAHGHMDDSCARQFVTFLHCLPDLTAFRILGPYIRGLVLEGLTAGPGSYGCPKLKEISFLYVNDANLSILCRMVQSRATFPGSKPLTEVSIEDCEPSLSDISRPLVEWAAFESVVRRSAKKVLWKWDLDFHVQRVSQLLSTSLKNTQRGVRVA